MSCSDSSKTTEAECVAPAVWTPAAGGRRGMKVKTLRRMLKKKGMKTTGKKATLMKRLHMRGGGGALAPSPFASGGDSSLGPASPAGNYGEPTPSYAAAVSSGLSGGRRRRRRE